MKGKNIMLKPEMLEKIRILEERKGVAQTIECAPELEQSPDKTPILTGDFIDGAYAKAQKYTLGISNSLKIPTSNSVSPYSAEFIGESVIIPHKKAAIASKTIELGKLALSVPYTEELAQDSELYKQFLRNNLPKAISYAINYSIIYGSNEIEAQNSSIEGIVDSDSTYETVAVAASAIGGQIRDMYKNVSCSEDNIWMFSKGAFDTVLDNAASLVTWEAKEAYILGIPVYCSLFLKPGDYVLGDFTKYIIAQKSLKQAVSEHVYFLDDQNVDKITLRIGGKVGSGPYTSWSHALCSDDYIYGSTMESNLTGINLDSLWIGGSSGSSGVSGLQFTYAGNNILKSNICGHTGGTITSAGDVVIDPTYWTSENVVITATGVDYLSGTFSNAPIRNLSMIDPKNGIFVTVSDTITATDSNFVYSGTTVGDISGGVDLDSGYFSMSNLLTGTSYSFDATYEQTNTIDLSGGGFTAEWSISNSTSKYPFSCISGM